MMLMAELNNVGLDHRWISVHEDALAGLREEVDGALLVIAHCDGAVDAPAGARAPGVKDKPRRRDPPS